MKDGLYRDTVHPIKKATRQKIEICVLNAYKKGVK
jgi:DNA-binding cell septation regulator SpoVG